MSWHKAHTEFQNYMIVKRIIPSVATATGNLPFFILPESVLPCICVAVGRNRNLSPTQILLLLKLIGKIHTDCTKVSKKL